MDTTKKASDLLKKVALQHKKLNHDVMLGSNFVECLTCKFHAHTHYGEDQYIIHHNSDYSINERINEIY